MGGDGWGFVGISLDVFPCRDYTPCRGLKANQVGREDASVVKGLVFHNRRGYIRQLEATSKI